MRRSFPCYGVRYPSSLGLPVVRPSCRRPDYQPGKACGTVAGQAGGFHPATMSFDLSARVWAHSRAKGLNKYVLLAIADFANQKTGLCFPSIRSIASKTGLSERTIQRSIRYLESISELHQSYQEGPHGSCHYSIGLPEIGESRSHPEKSIRDSHGVTTGQVGATIRPSGVLGGQISGDRVTPKPGSESGKELGTQPRTGVFSSEIPERKKSSYHRNWDNG